MDQIPGVFQNIHDSFDEIDSKSLYPFYQKNQQQTNLDSTGEYFEGWQLMVSGPEIFRCHWVRFIVLH